MPYCKKLCARVPSKPLGTGRGGLDGSAAVTVGPDVNAVVDGAHDFGIVSAVLDSPSRSGQRRQVAVIAWVQRRDLKENGLPASPVTGTSCEFLLPVASASTSR